MLTRTHASSGYRHARLLLDPAIAAIILVLVSPILLIAAVFIAADGGPVFFRQRRLGKDAKPFSVIKLRTMIPDADAHLDANGLPVRQRVTQVGRLLRCTSIDELPQLINIIRGDMALIGPRPILPRMLPHMTERERDRFSVLPGITGLAQIKGRNFLRWSRRFKFDVSYARAMSLRLDLYIAMETIRLVLGARDIAPDINRNVVDDVSIRPVLRSSGE
jgi:lipopolysaccharide/colanic/teichoic acid biosynthesis glycosyltransferase